MATVRAALIQAYANMPKAEAIRKHEGLIAQDGLYRRLYALQMDPGSR